MRPIQIWVRTAGVIDAARTDHHRHRCPAHEAGHVKVGQRVRAFPPESRSSMFQAKVTRVTSDGARTSVSAVLSGQRHEGSSRYILEIVTEPIEFLSVPNEAIIETDGKHVVYVQAEKGRYVPREIQPGVQGELYHAGAGRPDGGRAGRDVRQLLHRRRSQAEGVLAAAR